MARRVYGLWGFNIVFTQGATSPNNATISLGESGSGGSKEIRASGGTQREGGLGMSLGMG